MNLISLAIPAFMIANYAVNPVFAPDTAPNTSFYKPTTALILEAPKPTTVSSIEQARQLNSLVKHKDHASNLKHKTQVTKHQLATLHKGKLTLTAQKAHTKTDAKSKTHLATADHKTKPHVIASSGHARQGTASWYGSRFHGKRTANGERYDMYSLTAAHKTLPLSSYVQVTNLKNNRSVIVRINDRGPYHSNRVMDLSYAAAKQLGIHSAGTGTISITPVALK